MGRNDDNYEFPIVYGVDASPYRVSVRSMLYHPGTAVNLFGVSCAGLGISVDNHGARDLPYAGSQHFDVRLTGLPNSTSALFVSWQDRRGSRPAEPTPS
ncbi:MAG: hypothetical protein AAF628_13070 [Planctomycetota bacterium]